MQLLARLMDQALAARGERRTSSSPPPATPAAPRSKLSATASQIDVVVLFPHGRISDVQRRMMTTAQAANVHAVAIDGTFDDCQAIVKGMFNHPAFRERVRLSGVNSINWARIVAQTVYYFTAAVALGAPQRRSPSPCRPAISATSMPATCRAHGPADRPAGHRYQRQRHFGADARNRRLRIARRGGDHVAVDGHPGVVEFRTAAVRCL